MTLTSQFSFDEVRQVLGGVLGPDVHAKRVDSLCDATLGVLHSGSLAVAAIGHGLAAARGVLTKHAIKQVDRLLSNPGIKIDEVPRCFRWKVHTLRLRSHAGAGLTAAPNLA